MAAAFRETFLTAEALSESSSVGSPSRLCCNLHGVILHTLAVASCCTGPFAIQKLVGNFRHYRKVLKFPQRAKAGVG